LFLFFFIFCCGVAQPLLALTAKEILYQADQWRGYSGSFMMQATVKDHLPPQEDTSITMMILVKDITTTLAQYLFPAQEKGKMLLMVQDNMWFYQPNLEKPIRISPRQRLLGNVSNADIARVNFYADYDPELIKTENDRYVLNLTAKDEGTTYAKIIYWVYKADYKPVKAEFYALSGKLIKTAAYEQFSPIGQAGEVKLSKIIIYDPIRTDHYSEINYSSMKKRVFAEKYFNINYLKNIRSEF